MAEMKSGKRPSIGRAELDWATQYEQSVLPPDIRFPKVGEIYEAVQDTDVQFEIYFSAPITNSGSGGLLKGERVKIKLVSPLFGVANTARIAGHCRAVNSCSSAMHPDPDWGIP